VHPLSVLIPRLLPSLSVIRMGAEKPYLKCVACKDVCGYKLDIMEGWHIHPLIQQIVIQIDVIADNLLKVSVIWSE